MLKKLRLLIKVSRPLSWPLVALLFAMGMVISNAPITLVAVANLVILVALLPLAVFGINDIYDFDSDAVNPRKSLKGSAYGGVLEKGKHRLVKSAAIVATAVLAVFPFLTRNATNILATAVALGIAWAYSAPPLRLKEKPPFDSLSNAALIWAVSLAGFSYGGGISMLPRTVYFASLGAAAIHAIAAIMDYSPDRKTGAKTIATVLGKRWAAAFALAVMLAITFFSGIASIPLRVIIGYVLFSSFILVIKDSELLARRLFKFGYFPGIVAMAVFIYQQFYK